MQYRADQEPVPSASLSRLPASAEEPSARPEPADLDTIEYAVLGEIGVDKRDLFVHSLFDRSIEAYERVLRQLYASTNWSEASKIIADDVFRAFQINIYSDPAILFTDAVEARYLERKT